jgi:hypothetical protein
VTNEEFARLAATGLPLIVDEVFRDYPLEGGPAGSPPDSHLTFFLGGLSKSAGLPHYKLGWIRVGGAEPAKRAAIAALELIADNYLSVSTPVQAALPQLLRIGSEIRAAISERLRSNLHMLRERASASRSIEVLPVEGGWTVVLRLPATRSDEERALHLLERGVAVHPGYFFDFPGDGFLVLSLLTPPGDLETGFRIIADTAAQ